MRLVHYQYKPEFAATVGIENTAETGNDFINSKFECLPPSSRFFVHRISCYHLNVFIFDLSFAVCAFLCKCCCCFFNLTFILLAKTAAQKKFHIKEEATDLNKQQINQQIYQCSVAGYV